MAKFLVNLLHIFLWVTTQTISGLRVVDTFLKRTYEHDDITQIYVANDTDR